MLFKRAALRGLDMMAFRGRALSFVSSARAISRLTRDTDKPSSRAIALMLRALSVWALYSASSRFWHLASHWASVRDLRR